jgi:hypothetical protein
MHKKQMLEAQTQTIQEVHSMTGILTILSTFNSKNKYTSMFKG